MSVVFKKGSDYYKTIACADTDKLTDSSEDVALFNSSVKVVLGTDGKLIYVTRGNTDFTFCEGWQNTLMLTICPDAIYFTANVFAWKDKTEYTFDVK